MKTNAAQSSYEARLAAIRASAPSRSRARGLCRQIAAQCGSVKLTLALSDDLARGVQLAKLQRAIT